MIKQLTIKESVILASKGLLTGVIMAAGLGLMITVPLALGWI